MGGADVRLRNDFQKRGAGTVEVHIALRFPVVMDQLTGILLHVDTGEADTAALAIHFDVKMAMLADRQIKLGDLIAFGQVGVEIILAGKDVFAADLAIGRQAQLDGRLHHLLV